MRSHPLINRSSELPIYKQVESWLRSEITSGRYKEGEKLPSTREICEVFGGINHITVRQAVSALARENLISTVHGRGSFVQKRKAHIPRIGIALPNFVDEFTIEIVQGIQEVLDEVSPTTGLRGGTEVLFDARNSSDRELDHLLHLEDWPLDGLILHPVGYSNLVERLMELRVKKFPFVLVDWISTEAGFPSVAADNYKGGYQITSHLLQTGRKNLAWIGNTQYYASALLRHNGFRDALNDAGLPYRKEWMLELGVEKLHTPSLYRFESFLRNILDNHLTVDGIVCANDIEAITCLELLKKMEVPVPDRIAITGFDNRKDTQNSTPPLTTISQPVREMGRSAAKMLLGQIQNHKAKPQQITLPVDLVIRGSSITQK